jgi:hypothetical protein
MSIRAQMEEQGYTDPEVLRLADEEDKDWAENGGEKADDLAFERHEAMDRVDRDARR